MREFGSWTRISSWAEIVVLPERPVISNDGHFPECASSIHCLRECVQATRMRKARGASGIEPEEEFEDAAKLCALMMEAIERAKAMHLKWKRVCWGREGREGVEEVANYLDMVADHGRACGWNMRNVYGIVDDLKPRKRRKKDEEETDEDE